MHTSGNFLAKVSARSYDLSFFIVIAMLNMMLFNIMSEMPIYECVTTTGEFLLLKWGSNKQTPGPETPCDESTVPCGTVESVISICHNSRESIKISLGDDSKLPKVVSKQFFKKKAIGLQRFDANFVAQS